MTILAAEFKQKEADMQGQVKAVKYGLLINDERVRDINDRVDFPKTLLEAAPLRRVKPDAVQYGG